MEFYGKKFEKKIIWIYTSRDLLRKLLRRCPGDGYEVQTRNGKLNWILAAAKNNAVEIKYVK